MIDAAAIKARKEKAGETSATVGTTASSGASGNATLLLDTKNVTYKVQFPPNTSQADMEKIVYNLKQKLGVAAPAPLAVQAVAGVSVAGQPAAAATTQAAADPATQVAL